MEEPSFSFTHGGLAIGQWAPEQPEQKPAILTADGKLFAVSMAQ